MKKKVPQEEKSKQTSTVIKSKRAKLGDITNSVVEVSKKKKQEQHYKSAKSIKKINLCTLDTSKRKKSKNSSMAVNQPRYQSSADNIKFVQPLAVTIDNQSKFCTMYDSIFKDKLSSVQQQNKYLSQMNSELKSQLSKAHEQNISLNKCQGTLRQENKNLSYKFQSQSQCFNKKQIDLKSKIKQMSIQNNKLQQNSSNQQQNYLKQQQKSKQELEKLNKQKSAQQVQLSKLTEEMIILKNKIKTQNTDKIKYIGELELQIQQAKGKSYDLEANNTKMLKQIKQKMVGFKNYITIKNVVKNESQQTQFNLNQIFTTISEVTNQIIQLKKQIQQLKHSQQQYKQSEQQNHQKQILLIKQIQQCKLENKQMKELIKVLKQNQYAIQLKADKLRQSSVQNAQAQINRLSGVQKKLIETKNSLEYWKKKFDESKLENIKYKKESEALIEQNKTLREQVKITLLSIDKLESQRANQIKHTKLQKERIDNHTSLDQRKKIEEFENEILKLQNEKRTMIRQSSVVSEKLQVFRQKVIILESKLRQNKNFIEQTPKKNRQMNSQSFVLNNFNTVASHDISILNNSHYSQRSQSKNLMQYRGDTQSKLQEQFRSSNVFSFSPEKPKGICSIMNK